MIVKLRSTKRVQVKMTMWFTDGTVYTTQIFLIGSLGNQVEHQAVGRRTDELRQLRLSYDGYDYNYPIQVHKTEPEWRLKTIDIYGNRDKWSELLRTKALEAEKDEFEYPEADYSTAPTYEV